VDVRWRTPSAASGIACVLLFSAGLVFADLLASPGFPAFDASVSRIAEFFDGNRSEALGLSVCHCFAALALLVFAAHLRSLLRESGGDDDAAALAFAGGAIAASFLLLSALLYWVLTRSEVATEPGTAEAMLLLSYTAGGPAILIPAVPLLAVTSVVGVRAGFLPAWIARLGLAAALLSVLSPIGLLWDDAFALLLVAAFLFFVWLFATSVVLVRRAYPARGGAERRHGSARPEGDEVSSS
jgi:hypothetical protein